jgi:hypothetical protein
VNPQLEQLDQQLQANAARANDLAVRAGNKFSLRPSPQRWSPAECVEHLRITNEAYFPLLGDALSAARAKGTGMNRPYKLDPIGALLVWFLEPPVRFRVPAPPGFIPPIALDPANVLSNFLASQDAAREFVISADGLAIDKVKIRSPFSRHVRYNVWSAFCSAAAHQRRHLAQAEGALRAL